MVFHPRLAALFTFGIIVACAQTGGGRIPQTKEKKKMDALAVGTRPKTKAVLPGESFPVETVFENHGTAPLEVPNSAGPSPFSYELLWEKDRSLRYEVSQDRRDSRRMVDEPEPLDLPPETLDPAHHIQRSEDLAELSNLDFAPG